MLREDVLWEVVELPGGALCAFKKSLYFLMTPIFCKLENKVILKS